MRLIETGILLTLLLSAGTLLVNAERRPGWLRGIPVITLILVLLHVWVEGARWQLVPAYGLTGIFAVLGFAAWRTPSHSASQSDRKWLRFSGAVCSLILIGITAAGATALPVFQLPEPSGASAVGTQKLLLEDKDRPEVITEDPDDHRKLAVRVWYPAVPQDASKRMSYMPSEEAAAFARKYGLPPFTTSHLSLVETHAIEGAPVAEDQPAYPVLLFSHGYNVPPSIYTSLLPEIASHGFIIFAVNHTYESTVSVFSDSRVATFHQGFYEREYDGVWGRIGELEQQYWSAGSGPKKRGVIQDMTYVHPMSDMLRRWTDDLSFVVDELERRNSDDAQPSYFSRLDLSRLGVLGHSAGGATAGQAMLSDDRMWAGVNWDGAQWGAVIDSTFTRPFMRIEAVRDSATFAPNDLIYRGASQDVLYTLKIEGAGHGSFSDIPFLIPIPQINESGSINHQRATEIITTYTIAFFKKHLLGVESTALDQTTTKYPAVKLDVTKAGEDTLQSSGL